LVADNPTNDLAPEERHFWVLPNLYGAERNHLEKLSGFPMLKTGKDVDSNKVFA